MTQAARSHLRSVPSVEPSFDELVRDASAGDRRAMTALYKQFAGELAAVVCRISGRESDLEDVVGQTFVDAFHHLRQRQRVRTESASRELATPTSLRCLLVGLAIRNLGNELGRIEDAFVVELARSGRTQAAWDLERLYEALSGLPARLRVPWVLAKLERHSTLDVAQECRISHDAACRRISKADIYLRRRIGSG